jgi:putative spermidine/putrescine transport system substrate-binding protein
MMVERSLGKGRTGLVVPSRRQVLLGAAAATSAVALARPSIAQAPAGSEGEVVFACNGGLTQKAFEEIFIPEFTKSTGIKVTFVAGQPADSLAKVRAQGAAPQIDVLWLAGGVTYQAIDGGFVQPLDWSLIPNRSEISPSSIVLDAAAPIGLTVCGLLTNTDVYKAKGWAAPTSWFDMWDPKYRGHVGLYSINLTSSTAMLAKIAQSLTGDFRKLDAAYAKFRELRSNMLGFYPSGGAWETAMQQGDLWIGMNTSVRAQQMAAAGLPVGFHELKEGFVGYEAWAGVVKNARRPKAAHAWVNYLLSNDFQQRMPETIGYSPVSRNAKIREDLAAYFPAGDKVFVPDWQYLSKELPNIVAQWNRQVER